MRRELRGVSAAAIIVLWAISPAAAQFVEGIGESGNFDQFGIEMVYYSGVAQLNNVDEAVNALLSGQGERFDGVVSFANHADVGGSAGGGYTLSAPKEPWPGLPDGDTNDFTWLYNGHIFNPVDQVLTFGFDGDDGHRMVVEGADFTVTAGGGAVKPENTNTVEFFGNTGNAFTTASTFLSAGTKRVQFIGYERGGGAFTEFFSAVGDVTSARWLAVGDDSVIPDEIVQPLIHLNAPAQVGNASDASNFPEIRDTALNNFGQLGIGSIETLILSDPGAAGCPKPEFNSLGHDFPISDGSDQNNFTTAILGEFVVDNGNEISGETLDLSIALLSDDAAQLRINGVDFVGIGALSDARAELIDVEGDMALTGDYNTCDINAIGHVTIAEGVYPFESYHRENGGNAGWQVWVGDGHQAGWSQASFSPISTSVEPTQVPGNTGLRLVPEGFVGMEPWPGDVDGDGKTDVADLNIMALNWRATGVTMAEGDLTGDGIVNSADLNILAINWQTMRPAGAAVPEPSSVMLLLAGTLAAIGRLRTMRR